MMEQRRNFVKNSPTESRHRWHNRFRQEHASKFKEARTNLVNKNRENQWINNTLSQEGERILRENEEAMRQQGLLDVDIDSLIQENLELEQGIFEDSALEQLAMQEQEKLDREIRFYETSKESFICVNCCKTNLVPSSKHNVPIALCPNCGFYATEKCLYKILNMVDTHASTCTDKIDLSLEPGTDNTIIANCDSCGLFDMFYM